ncbi:hypothetical protein ACFTWH_03540 [Streptomyces sp. NPDC057011]|uniref:hypothetical protein n=1 Tax=unclassified Streptomyces TaxID=2593676 RepID=UPI0036407498
MIKVSLYRSDLTEIEHVFTDEEGLYSVAIPAGETVTVRQARTSGRRRTWTH